MGCTCEIYGMYMYMRFMGCIWDLWDVHGMYVGCTWNVYGMYIFTV